MQTPPEEGAKQRAVEVEVEVEVKIDIEPVQVTGLAAGGDGIGRLSDGRVVFIDGGVPGDRVELADLVFKKRLARARIGKLIERSAQRVEPRCAHFGSCGGCLWQHVDYEAQLDAKRGIVRDALERIGGFALAHDVEITGSPDPYGYRARARLVESGGRVGYRARRSHSIQEIEECPILVPAARSALADLDRSIRSTSPERVASDSPKSVRRRRAPVEWIISAGTSGSVTTRKAGRHAGRKSKRRNHDAAARSATKPDDEKAGGRGIPRSVTLEVLGERLRAGSESFIQGNALLWDALAEEVRRQCTAGSDTSSPVRFIELYAGIGFLTLPLARAGAVGVAIESDRSALADLAANLASSGLAKQVEVLRGRVEERGDLAARFAAADVLLTDPPRTGLDAKVRDMIAAVGPRRLVYVSCDPATLARDLRVFREAGYALESVRALDLFPQTPHVEVVVRLERVAKDGTDRGKGGG